MKNAQSENNVSTNEAIKRLKKKSREIRETHVVPQIDEDEPTGLLSGGPEHLDLPDNDNDES